MDSDKKNKQPPIPLRFNFRSTDYVGLARPLAQSTDPEVGNSFDIFLEDNLEGTLTRDGSGNWTMKGIDRELAEKIGELIDSWYETTGID